MELSAFILSIFAFLISTILAIISIKQNEKYKNINLNAKYFEKIFDEYLIVDIPKKRGYIRFENGKLTDFEKLTDGLIEMLEKALYFKYRDKKFYNELKNLVTELEDYLSSICNKEVDNEDQAKVYLEIHEKITKIYECINNAHLGT